MTSLGIKLNNDGLFLLVSAYSRSKQEEGLLYIMSDFVYCNCVHNIVRESHVYLESKQESLYTISFRLLRQGVC